MATENKAYMRGMQELRRSGAAGKHVDRRTRRARTRAAANLRAVRESGRV